MRQRMVSFVSVFGIALSAVLLLRFSPSGRKPHGPEPVTPTPLRHVYVSPAVARLQAAYRSLPSAMRVRLAMGVPFDELPSRFGSAIRAVIGEQLNARLEAAHTNLAIGEIDPGKYALERAYRDFVPRHLSRYRINTTGDNYAIVLFRSALPGQHVPQRDASGGSTGICRIR